MDSPQQLLSDISSLLHRFTGEKSGEGELVLYLGEMVEGSEQLSSAMIAVGDWGLERIGKNGDWEGYYFTFSWPEQAKSFLILWRDVIFQLQKARIRVRDNEVSAADLDLLWKRSVETLRDAAEEFRLVFSEASEGSSKAHMKEVDLWRLQHNPWPAYREQLISLARQCSNLQEQHEKLWDISKKFDEIRVFVENAAGFCVNELESCKALAREAIDYVDGALSREKDLKLGKVAVHLEDLEEKVQLPDHLTLFGEEVEKVLKPLEGKIQVPVNTHGGMIQYKELTPAKNTKQWMEAALMPLLYEVWEITENLSNGLKMSLVNIRNRAILLSAEGKVQNWDRTDFCLPLEAFLQKAQEWEEALRGLENQISYRIEEEFRLSHIYNLEEGFLPVSLQTSINQLRINENPILVKSKKWIGKQMGVLRRFKIHVEKEETLSDAEKIVRFIHSRTSHEDANAYTSIFLTKGYMGESFWVGREEELQHMESLVSNWRNGFGGAVILSGNRLSGRSLFGEIVANRFFPQKTIRLSPKLPVNVQGRTLPAGYDLDRALEFIRKHTLNQYPLVWIDDLELWWDAHIPLNQNVRNLWDHIDSYASQHFFMVSMGTHLKMHLKRFYGIDQIFQAEINLDKMGAREIKNAILIRHGATHKTLVDPSGKELSPQQFQKITQEIYRTTEGNIGDALNRWAFSIRMEDADKVRFEETPDFDLPDFRNPDTALLLTTLMKEKRSNEYRLRKLFGPPFRENYSSLLQRLLTVRLLTRQIDGWLEINEIAVNEVARLLEEKNYL